jgi:hypothetical protein
LPGTNNEDHPQKYSRIAGLQAEFFNPRPCEYTRMLITRPFMNKDKSEDGFHISVQNCVERRAEFSFKMSKKYDCGTVTVAHSFDVCAS